MKTDKVILTKKQAEALEELKKTHSAESIIQIVADPQKNHTGLAGEIVNSMSLDVLIRALYVGFDIQKEPTHIDLPTVRIWKTDYKRKNEVLCKRVKYYF